ncbi:MAG: DNA polymerase III subunit beta [Minisyncoccota bacterium]
MKFIAPARAFSDAITAVSRVVENRNTYPILANVLLSADSDGKVSLRATDLDIEVTLGFEAKVESPGQTTVPAKTLDGILRKLDKAWDVTFEVTGENAATVKAGRSRFSLQTMSPDSFPDLKSGEFTHRFDLAGVDLRRIIDKTSFAISTEETRYYLNGIYLHTIQDGDLVLRGVATDGHRMARCQVPAPDGAVDMPGIIIPRKTVAEIAKLIAKVETVGVEVSVNKIRVTVGGVALLSKLIEGTFPDYLRVTPPLSNTIAEVDAKALAAALDRVSTVASERGGKAVKFSLKDGLLELEVSNPDHGTSQEDMAVEWGGGPLEIGFNARYASDVLSVLSGKTVKISLTDAGAPARLFTDDDPGTLVVLMPMRV